MNRDYVLVTATWNEEKYIHHTIGAVLKQTILPSAWVIVSDGSTDGTDEIVKAAAARNDFVVYVRKERTQEQKGFASKVYAIREGLNHLNNLSYSFIGHLDSDVSFAPDYYEQVLRKFDDDPRLGIAGGFILEEQANRFRSRPSNTSRSVAGAIQLFRKECYEAIGGLIPLECGGEDWYAEIRARMMGWEVKAFPDLQVMHHKRSVDARGLMAEHFRQGAVDQILGTHVVFELAKGFRRIIEAPYLAGSIVRLAGYTWSRYRRSNMGVPEEVKGFLHEEQVARLKSIVSGISKGKA
jgi:biofilm PGA synthesis N-glycosyltransferase PgaC